MPDCAACLETQDLLDSALIVVPRVSYLVGIFCFFGELEFILVLAMTGSEPEERDGSGTKLWG